MDVEIFALAIIVMLVCSIAGFSTGVVATYTIMRAEHFVKKIAEGYLKLLDQQFEQGATENANKPRAVA